MIEKLYADSNAQIADAAKRSLEVQKGKEILKKHYKDRFDMIHDTMKS